MRYSVVRIDGELIGEGTVPVAFVIDSQPGDGGSPRAICRVPDPFSASSPAEVIVNALNASVE